MNSSLCSATTWERLNLENEIIYFYTPENDEEKKRQRKKSFTVAAAFVGRRRECEKEDGERVKCKLMNHSGDLFFQCQTSSQDEMTRRITVKWRELTVDEFCIEEK